jgi:methionyl-tRNA synthetase
MDDDLKSVCVEVRDKTIRAMDTLHVADSISDIFQLFRRCNKYIDETEPWVLGKDEAKKDRLSTVLYNLVEGITIGASLLFPFLPETAEKIAQQLNTQLRDFDELDKFGLYPDGNKVTDAPQMLFARADVKEILAKTAEIEKKQKEDFKAAQKIAYENLKKAGKLTAANMAGDKKTGAVVEDSIEEDGDGKDTNPIILDKKPEISYDDFATMQFRVGKILSCEEVKKSKKLLCSKVQVGDDVLQIVSGIKKYYSAEEMVGKRVMVLTNLKPAKLAGIESEGMLLCAEDADGNLALMTPEKTMPSGAEIC